MFSVHTTPEELKTKSLQKTNQHLSSYVDSRQKKITRANHAELSVSWKYFLDEREKMKTMVSKSSYPANFSKLCQPSVNSVYHFKLPKAKNQILKVKITHLRFLKIRSQKMKYSVWQYNAIEEAFL